MTRKPFTVQKANHTLPLVRRIVEDIVVCYRRWEMRIDEFEVAAVGSRSDSPDARAEALEGEAVALAEQIARFEVELAELGVRCIDHRAGVVDFPGLLDGRAVALCWRLGEPAVGYWHEVGAAVPANGRFPLRYPIPIRAA